MADQKTETPSNMPMSYDDYFEFLDEMMSLFQDKEEREVIIISNPKL